MIQKAILILSFLIGVSLSSFAQTYILNEDFSSANGSTPPGQWTSYSLTTVSSDIWKFDNPGQQSLNYPVIGQFAIFDSDTYSNNTLLDESVLESPSFDASVGTNVYLFFDHYFAGSAGDTGFIEVYNGSIWQTLSIFTFATGNSTSEQYNVSAALGGNPNSKIRFRWKGNGNNFWAIDNISVFVPASLDAGILTLTNPVMPFLAGTHSIKVNLKNFGANTLNSLLINWSVNGIQQSAVNWSGTLPFLDTIYNYTIGDYTFTSGEIIDLKIWLSSVNGQIDASPLNDTLMIIIGSSLCGDYTIGGLSPDFANFDEAVTVLSNAGISCPVVFFVRDGLYNEQIEIGPIAGTSQINTVTFRGESLDSSLVSLEFLSPNAVLNYTLHLSQTHWVNFEHIGIYRGHSGYATQISNYSNNLNFRNCLLNGVIGLHIGHYVSNISCNQTTFKHGPHYMDQGFVIDGIDWYSVNQPQQISIDSCIFLSPYNRGFTIDWAKNISFTNNQIIPPINSGEWSGVISHSDSIEIINNLFEEANRGLHIYASSYAIVHQNTFTSIKYLGIETRDLSGNIIISHNRFLNIYNSDALYFWNASGVNITNNYFHLSGTAEKNGINFEESSNNNNVKFNSFNIENKNQQSACIKLRKSQNLTLKNNILANFGDGFSLKADSISSIIESNYNDFYASSKKYLYYNNTLFSSIGVWSGSSNFDLNSKNINPFYINSTNLSPNHSLLNSAGLNDIFVTFDIDSTLRSSPPDIGAKEFSICTNDAGINEIIDLANPLSFGLQSITIQLQNHGTSSLTSCIINWSVNGINQPPYSWTGNLSSQSNQNITLGTYNFISGENYSISAWTSFPNAMTDCKNYNDTVKLKDLMTPLCGTYTIGGLNPDFSSFNEAVTIISNSGISCPVLFLVRDGTYNEQIEIGIIPGTSSINTVTFRGESLDSSLVMIDYQTPDNVLNYTLHLNQAQWINFEHLGIYRGHWGNASQISNYSQNINFSNCLLNGVLGLYIGHYVSNITCDQITFRHGPYHMEQGCFIDGIDWNTTEQPENISIINSTFWNPHYRGITIDWSKNINFSNNQIIPPLNSGEWAGVISRSDSIVIFNNLIQDANRGFHVGASNNVLIHKNTFTSIDYLGIESRDYSANLEISSNRFLNIHNSDAIYFWYTSGANISNNYFHLTGAAEKNGIFFDENCHNNNVKLNSFNIENTNQQSTCVKLRNSQNLTLKNNILANYGNGFGLKADSVSSLFESNYNNFYSKSKKYVFYDNLIFNSMSGWSSLSNYDQNSLNYNPFYTSDINLTANHSSLNSAGIADAQIIHDIDSTLRSNPPDIGAKEFSPCSIDAGINEIIGVVNPLTAGLHDISIQLQNHGTNLLTSCQIHWSVNNIPQPIYSWTGSIASLANQNINIGSYTFLSDVSYEIKVWTAQPNLTIDCKNYNDTARLRDLSTPLCGTYTIGGTNPDFNNFSEAVTVLTNSGITCSVLFLVRDGFYNEQIEINSIPGASIINTITFRGESQDSSLVSLDYQLPDGVLNYTLHLNQAQWINFEHIGFYRGHSGIAVQISNYGKYINFDNCIMNGRVGLNIGHYVSDISCLSTTFKHGPHYFDVGVAVEGIYYYNIEQPQSIQIDSCVFFNPHWRAFSIYWTKKFQFTNNQIITTPYAGDWTGVLDHCDSIEIVNNFILDPHRGFHITTSSNILVDKNTFTSIEYVGIECIWYSSNITICNNRLLNVNNSHAIYVYHTTNNKIYNNFIHLTGAAERSGIFLEDGSHPTLIQFNSFNIQNTNHLAACITARNSNINNLTNNILSNIGGGYILNLDTLSSIFSMDYNNLFATGTNYILANGTVIPNLAAWQSANSTDANSFNYNPYYSAPDILRPYQREINGAGIPISDILLDIDGQIRDENSPDIGADEFTVDFGITELVAPSLHCSLTASDSIKVVLKQFGDIPFLNLQLAYQVNNGPIFTEIVPGSINNDLFFTFSQTQNLLTYGTYTFKIWIISSFDDNINNDTLIVERYSHPIPHLSAGYNINCANSPTNFYSSATVLSGNMDYYLWYFGDGNSEISQNPIHIYDTSGVYTVHLYAFAEVGCYHDTVFPINVMPTPNSEFSSSDVCLGIPMSFTNSSSVSTGSISYQWDFGDGDTSLDPNPNHLYNLPGNYPVTLISQASNGCTDTMIYVYTVHNLPVLNFQNLPTQICENNSPIQLEANLTGGEFVGTGVFGTIFYPSIASIGNISISYEYTDGNGCFNQISSSINVLSVPAIAIGSLVDVHCYGNSTGSITLALSGGTYPAVITQWNTGSTSNQLSNLPTGTYSVTVTDLNNCVDSANFQINQPNSPLQVLTNSSDVLCYGFSTGSIQANVSGGSAPYSSVSWSNGASGYLNNSLSEGIYMVTVSDIYGCTETAVDTIFQPSNALINFTVTNLLCPNIPSGSIQVVASGATPPYQSYSWSNGALGSQINGLLNGTYSLTLTDANNCTFTSTTQITSPAQWSANATTGVIKCYGDQTGSLLVNVSGATPPYQFYNWSNGGTSALIEDLPAGNYSVTVTDANNCTQSFSFTQTQPEEVNLFFIKEDVSCFGGNDGEINLSIAGGTLPYGVIIWSNSQQTEDIANLTAGIYSVTVFDANACKQMISITLTQPSEIVWTNSVTDVACFGDASGTIQVTVDGGVPPYQYLWNTSETSDIITHLVSGSYELTISDANLCQKTLIQEILTNPEIKIQGIIYPPSCIFAEDAAIAISPSGGVAPYSFIWSSGAIHDSIYQLPPGNYNVSVIDSLDCQLNYLFTIDETLSPCIDPPAIFSPNQDGINDTWILEGIEFTPGCKVTIIDRWGRTVYESIGYAVPWDGKYDGKAVPSDAYFYIVEYNNGFPPLSGKVTVIY